MLKKEPIQNKRCMSCRFCSWYEEYKNYYCDIRGCNENSLFVEYQGKFINGKWI